MSPPPEPSSSPLRARLDELRSRLAGLASERSDGDREAPRLVAVTKSVPPGRAAELVALGQLELGESRVQALEAKRAWFAEHGLEARWHLIGHLQRNKARRAVRLADEIHSVDSSALLETLDRVAGEEARRPAVYLEVQLVERTGRSGFGPEGLGAAVALARAAPNLELAGLMTMAAPPGEGPPARETFDRLAELRAGLAAEDFAQGRIRLSMGMSSDWQDAVRAGSDLVRIGSALFEEREEAPR